MVQIFDMRFKLYHALRSLQWPPYLTVMWVLSDSLKGLYADELSKREVRLADSTLGIVRETILARSVGGLEVAAVRLVDRWGRLQEMRSEERRLLAVQRQRRWCYGLPALWLTFTALAHEIAGSAEHHFGAEFVSGAVAERWNFSELLSESKVPVRVNFQESVPEDSPAVQTILSFLRIVDLAANERELWIDPIEFRTRILGE